MRQVTDRILSIAETAGMVASITALFLIMIAISSDALGRYLFSSPLTGEYEFVSLYLMVILTFLGLAKTQAAGRHVRVAILEPLLLKLPWVISHRLTALVTAVGFAILTVITGEEAVARFAARTTMIGVVEFPTYLSYCWVPLGSGLLLLRMIHQVIWPPQLDAEAIDEMAE